MIIALIIKQNFCRQELFLIRWNKSIFNNSYFFFIFVNCHQFIKLTLLKIKQQFLMIQEDSFPTFALDIDCDFQSSDQKLSPFRNDLAQNTLLIEDGNIFAFSSIGKRNANLDKFDYICRQTYTLLGIYDGHGDGNVSSFLKDNLLKRLQSHELFIKNTEEAIRQVLYKIEEQVLQKYQKGSTVLVVVITENHILAANLGDSQLFGLTKEQGKLVQMTVAHNLKNQKEIAEVISKGGLIFKRGNQYRINGQLNISRSIGDRKHKNYMSKEPQFFSFQKQKYKKIMLTTDGFYTHHLFQSELCKRSVKQIYKKVMKGSQGYGFSDNASILSYKFKQRKWSNCSKSQ